MQLSQNMYIDDVFLAAENFMNFWNQQGFYSTLPRRMQKAIANKMAKVNLDFVGLMNESYGAKEIAQINCQVLMLTGKKSPSVSHCIAAKIMKNLQHCKSVSVNAGHMGLITEAKSIQPIIAEFLKGV